MLATTPTTVLEAVNQIIATIGEPPVNTIEDSGVMDAVMALQALSSVNRSVQAKGWHWNTEDNFPLTAAYPSGEVYVPSNTLRADASGEWADRDFVLRGSRLYDRENHTYEIGETVTVNVVLLLDFEELPEAARNYITIKAARRFNEGQIGSQLLSSFTEKDELDALITLQEEEADTADLNILDNDFVRGVVLR